MRVSTGGCIFFEGPARNLRRLMRSFDSSGSPNSWSDARAVMETVLGRRASSWMSTRVYGGRFVSAKFEVARNEGAVAFRLIESKCFPGRWWNSFLSCEHEGREGYGERRTHLR